MRYFSKKIRLFCLTLALLMAFAPSALAASGFRLNAQEQAMIEMVNSGPLWAFGADAGS